MQGLEFLYLAMLIVGFAGSAGLVWWTRRAAQAGEDEVTTTYIAPPPERKTTGFGVSSRVTPTEQLPSITPDPQPQQIAQLIFSHRKSAGDRECPTCKRRFGETTVLCPFDATPLQSVGLRHKRTTRPAITGSRRPTCLSCGRRYESSAKFCYYDGNPLSGDSPAEVPIVRVCRACGSETTDAHATCGCSAPDVVEVDPSRTAVQMPTIPMMHCRRCNHVESSSKTHCPHDGELLYPVMNVSMNALPPTGIGPRRKVCEKCGKKFSSFAQYCAYDGTKLKHLN